MSLIDRRIARGPDARSIAGTAPGATRCLYAQHDSPGDGFTLPAGAPTRVGFHEATVECAAPFSVDRIDVRARSGDTIVFEGSWSVTLAFKE